MSTAACGFCRRKISMEVQAALGSDIVMAFDECAPGKATHDEARASMELTARWAKRSRAKFDQLQREGLDTGATGITQPDRVERRAGTLWHCSGRRAPRSETRKPGTHSGNRFRWLRDWRPERWGREVCHVGRGRRGRSARCRPTSPRYLMGVGTPEDLIEAVARGVDMFDCVLPTRNGRTGQAFTSRGKLNVKNAQWAEDSDLWTNPARAQSANDTRAPTFGTFINRARCWPVSC